MENCICTHAHNLHYQYSISSGLGRGRCSGYECSCLNYESNTAEAARLVAHQGRRDRADRLAAVLEECGKETAFIVRPEEGVITLWYCGTRFTVSEVVPE